MSTAARVNVMLVGLALAGATACVGADRAPASRAVAAPARAPAPAPLATGTPARPVDSTDDAYVEREAQRLDSMRVEMARLEQALAHAPAAEQPRLLLELGRVKAAYIAPPIGPHAEYARARPEEYGYDETGGRFLYNGKDFRTLMARFPADSLADDAAWELTLLPLGGECEGFVMCYVDSGWRMVREFLRDYPASPHAPAALERAIAAFEGPLADVTDLTKATEYYDAADLPPLLAQFDSVTAGLPDSLRARAASYSAKLRGRLVKR